MKTNTESVMQAFENLLEGILSQPFSEEDALVWMILLHTHQFCLQNGTSETCLAALTQRSAAEVIAHFWPDRSDRRSDYSYWYALYNRRGAFEDLTQVPSSLLAGLVQCRDRLAKNPQIRAIVEDE
jgi:hypothetical protein